MKIFAHRGYTINDIKQNSIESLRAALNNGFEGLEFDVWFVNGQLVVVHDKPENAEGLPRFASFFANCNKIKYWIDFKNLDINNAREALELAKFDIKNSKTNLQNIYFAPFIEKLVDAIPIYSIIREIFGNEAQVMALRCDEIVPENLQRYYQDLKKNNIKFLSVLHTNINENFMKIFRDVEVFAWTINDIKRISELDNLGVKNCTSDNITPKEYESRK